MLEYFDAYLIGLTAMPSEQAFGFFHQNLAMEYNHEMAVADGVNVMVAGRGIVHSERERPEITATDHSLQGLQLWLARPDADEEAAPAFHHYPGATLPALNFDGVPVCVMLGSAYGVISPVRQRRRIFQSSLSDMHKPLLQFA